MKFQKFIFLFKDREIEEWKISGFKMKKFKSFLVKLESKGKIKR